MSRRNFTALFGIALMLSHLDPAKAATQHLSKFVVFLQAPPADADCLYFQLDGVTTADSLAPGNPWFAIPRAHKGFREIYSMLLMAKATQTPVNVRTTGNLAGGECGAYTGVQEVYLQ